MKIFKNTTALFLCVIMLLSSVCCAPFALFAYSDDLVDTDAYNSMISSMAQQMKERQNKVSASMDVALKYNDSENDYALDEAYVEQTYESPEFYNQVFEDIFKFNTDDPALGDYLYNSVWEYHSSGHHAKVFNTSAAGAMLDVKAFRITYTFTVDYYSDYEQEQAVYDFAQWFKAAYNLDNLSEYKKTKTIYDFVVRNTEYDDEVFTGEFSQNVNCDRFKIAHSAYGALYGNLIDYDENGNINYDATVTPVSLAKSRYDNSIQPPTADSQIVCAKADQGLAVCEGFSKLFFYLCKDNGIDCHIVDGDYDESISKYDPHEWNYVRLDDGCGDGYKWFYVDSTFAEQHSQKYMDSNNYHFFLRGTANEYFALDVHQQPYKNRGTGENQKKQLYDWYGGVWNGDSAVSDIDYRFAKTEIDKDKLLEKGVNLVRLTDYGDGILKSISLRIDSEGCSEIVYENGELTATAVEGFLYNGYDSQYSFSIPYLIDEEYSYRVVSGKDANTDGGYYVVVLGDTTQCEIPFKVLPLSMSNNANYDSERTEIQNLTHFNNQSVKPKVLIYDTHENKLEPERDYYLKYYKAVSSTELSEISELKEMGNYIVDICFKGNYSGVYHVNFKIDKMLLSVADVATKEFEYIPKQLRENTTLTVDGKTVNVGSINNAQKLFETGVVYGSSPLVLNGVRIDKDVDYTVTGYNGGIEYGNTGTVTITGKQGSSKVIAGDSLAVPYKIADKYDVSLLDKTYADSNEKNRYYYDGTAHKPTSFDNLDATLIRGTEYKIVSYSDCVNAGNAKVVIEGIDENGTTGRATLYYRINPLSITDAKINYTSVSNGTVAFTVTYGNKTLVKGTDYTSTQTKTDTGYKITVKGIGNYADTTNIDLRVSSSSVGTGGTTGSTGGTSSSSTSSSKTTTSSNTVKKVVISMKKPKLTDLKSKKKKQLWLKYSRPGGTITGYQIQYSLKKNFKGAKSAKLKGANTRSVTIKKLKSKKKYYVRVRTYYVYGGKTYYSKWSNTKSAKTK